MAQFTRPADKASVTRAKHRVMLDENLRLEMPDGSMTSFDTASRVTGQGPVFTGRSTGLSASFFGNPTMGLVGASG